MTAVGGESSSKAFIHVIMVAMKKSPPISQDERELFRASVKNVTPLKQDKVIAKPPPKIRPRRSEPAPLPALDICDLGNDNMPDSVHTEDLLYFFRSGLQTRVIRKLRRGEFPIAGELDLHGLTVIQAHQALYQFLIHALDKGWQSVRIIHGKGSRSEQSTPILKNRVNYWLRQYPFVLGFCSALPAAGGKGAVYVLLKTSASSSPSHHLEPQEKFK